MWAALVFSLAISSQNPLTMPDSNKLRVVDALVEYQ